MFEVDPSIGMAGAAARANYAAGSNARIAERYRDSMEAWRTHAKELERRVADLELALAVAQAREEADDVLLAEWKALFPQSPLRRMVGKFRDGQPKTSATIIWENAFDAAARKRGITNPLAHRIS